MATSVNRSIVTDGLVACFDAASPKSWSGAAPWMDLSSFSSNGTGNFPTYTGINNGALAFNGTSQFVDFKINTSLNSPITIEMWCKITGSTAQYRDKIPFGFFNYSMYLIGSGALGFNTGNGDVYGINPTTVDNVLANKWCQWTMVMHTGISYINNIFYINTTGQTLSAQNGQGELTNSRTFNSGNLRISSTRNPTSSGYRFPMQCSIFRAYNKQLSQEEINQNFEATRIRYSL